MINNYIIAELDIEEENINKKIRIINSFEQFKREYELEDEEEDYKYQNENEIKENCKIKINNKIISFSYFYTFNKKGKFIIQYSFLNNLTKSNYLFCGCNYLTNIDLSNFNTENITKYE